MKINIGMILTSVCAALLVSSAAQAQITNNKIRIGVLTDLSGIYEQNAGNGSVEAVRMAAEEFGGKINGATIEVVAGDHQNKPDVAASVTNRWFDVEQVDMVTDLVNSAAAFAVKAIVTTARHSPEATGVLAKSASGALELVPLVTVPNLARALNELNDRGFMTVGLDSEGTENLGAVTLQQPLALVLGAEGKGLRQLTRETCSVVARLDMPGEIKSLNVSNAAVLALYIGARRLDLMK